MTEVISLGSGFIGIGGMVVLFVFALLFYQFVRILKPMIDKEWKYELFEEMVLDKIANKKGYDLKKAGIERKIIASKGFRRKIQEEMIKEMFGEEKRK